VIQLAPPASFRNLWKWRKSVARGASVRPVAYIYIGENGKFSISGILSVAGFLVDTIILSTNC
jgi:hypothetical protein